MQALRSFAAIIAALSVALAAAQPASAQAPTKLRFQAAFPASSLIFENFKFWAERVKALSGGRLQIETLPPGSVVPPFEILDAVHKGVLDGGHTAAAYCVMPQWSLSTIYRGMGQFMVIQLICLAVIILWPELVLWLPRALK
jgi:TRAP-type mannitol/chloroaromatic compound transport system substrate-binding protein